MCSFYTEKASLAASTPENKWKFHPWNTPTTVHRLVEAEQAPQGSHHHINKQGVGQGARCLVLVLRAAKAKARRARGINRVKVGSLDRRLHAPQNGSALFGQPGAGGANHRGGSQLMRFTRLDPGGQCHCCLAKMSM